MKKQFFFPVASRAKEALGPILIIFLLLQTLSIVGAQIYYTISISNSANDGTWSNQGTYLIVGYGVQHFGENAYLTSGSFTIIADPAPVPGYNFDRWIVSGGVSVQNQYESSTTIQVTGTGTLTAKYFKWQINVDAIPESQTITQGQGATHSVTVSLIQTWTSSISSTCPIDLQATNLPPSTSTTGASYILLTQSSMTQTVTRQITTHETDTPTGTYSINYVGTVESTSITSSDTVQVTVNSAQQPPDLICTDIQWSPCNPVTGETVTFSYTEQNIGDGDAPSHTNTIKLDETYLGDDIVPSLSAGESRVNTYSHTWTATAGGHDVLVVLDVHDAVDETNEVNNDYIETLGAKTEVPTDITVNLAPTEVPPNQNNLVNINGRLTRTDTSVGLEEPVKLEWPGGMTTISSDDEGYYSHTVTVSGQVEGSYPVTVSYLGDETANEIFLTTSTTVQLSVGKISTRIRLDINPTTVISNTWFELRINGFLERLNPTDGLYAETVHLSTGWGFETAVTTNEEGYFDLSTWFEVEEGNWLITASYDGDAQHSSCQETTVLATEVHNTPSISINSPLGVISLNVGDSQTFVVDLTDSDGDLDVVDWYLDGTPMDSHSVSGFTDSDSWSHIFDSTGDYLVEAEVADSTGDYSNPVAWTVNLETVQGEIYGMPWGRDYANYYVVKADEQNFARGEAYAYSTEHAGYLSIYSEAFVGGVGAIGVVGHGGSYTAPITGTYTIDFEYEVFGTAKARGASPEAILDFVWTLATDGAYALLPWLLDTIVVEGAEAVVSDLLNWEDAGIDANLIFNFAEESKVIPVYEYFNWQSWITWTTTPINQKYIDHITVDLEAGETYDFNYHLIGRTINTALLFKNSMCALELWAYPLQVAVIPPGGSVGQLPETTTLIFNTNPPTAGTIDFDSTTYSNGQITVVDKTTYSISQIPSSPQYEFLRWDSSETIEVPSISEPTTSITVTDNGWISADYLVLISFETSPPNLGSVNYDLDTQYQHGDIRWELNVLPKDNGEAHIIALPPQGYEFSHWEVTENLVVESSDIDTTMFVYGPGILRAVFEPTRSLALVSPYGGESWTQGTAQSITWSSSGDTGDYVMVELLKGGVLDTVLSNSADNAGVFEWEIPISQIPGSDYRIRITSVDYPTITDTSDADFTIVSAQTIEVPVGLCYIWWDFPQEYFPSLTMNITVYDDPSLDDGLYFQMYQAEINGVGFYFGLQTKLYQPGGSTERGYIFSRWETTDLENVRAAPGAWTESAGYEGDFVGLRKHLDWGVGRHSLKIAYIESDDVGDWYGVWVYDLDNGGSDYIGSIRFPSVDPAVSGIHDHWTTWTELYSKDNESTPLPEWHVSVDTVSIGDSRLIPESAVSAYSVIETTDVYCDEYKKIHFMMGSNVSRDHPAGTLYTSSDNYRPWIPECIYPLMGDIATELNPTIRWKSFDPDKDDINYDIYFGTDSSPPLYAGDVSASELQLSTLEQDTAYYWQVHADDGEYQTESPVWHFTTPAVALSVSSPVGGESWAQGSEQTVTWASTGTTGDHVKIELLKAGILDNVITDSTENDGLYNWIISSSQTPGSDYRIRVTSVDYPTITDTSDADFTIKPPDSVLFGDGFESGDFSAWDGSSASSGETASISTSPVHHGVYSAEFSSNGDSTSESSYVYSNLGSQGDIYVREYVYVSGSGLADYADRFWVMSLYAGWDVVGFAGWYEASGGPRWFLVIRSGTSTVIDFSDSAPVTGQWYCVELHWLKDSEDGLGELYVDGELVCSIGGRDTSVYGDATLLRAGLPYIGRCGPTSVNIDCVEVSEEYIGPEPSGARTWIVDDDGPADFTSIQDAINAAYDGDTVYVKNGSYIESIIMNKSISLIGENVNFTVISYIDYYLNNHTIKVTADDVIISGFTIKSFAFGSNCYLNKVNNVSIINNAITDFGAGVTLISSNNCNIGNNKIICDGGSDGPHLINIKRSNYNRIYGNYLAGIGDDGNGIDLYDSKNNTIENNQITFNYWNIYSSYTNNTLITNNLITGLGTGRGGLYIESSLNCILTKNNITDNDSCGVYFERSNYCKIYSNIIEGNGFGYGGSGLTLFSSSNFQIYHNSFIDNYPNNIRGSGYDTVWDNDYPSGGNYWSDYTGNDDYSGEQQDIPGSDGFGDTPYIIGQSNIDHYPLMAPWTPSTLTFSSPNGGERWTLGEIQSVTWTSPGDTGDYVKLELLKAGVLDRVISPSTENDGIFDWVVPVSQTSGSDYRVRVTSTDNPEITDSSDADFTITYIHGSSSPWIVDDDGPADFTSIQDAINIAYDGETVYVRNGTYIESLNVNKSIALIGENKENTIIEPIELMVGVNVSSNDVLISGFKINHDTFEPICLLNKVNNVTVVNNVFTPIFREGILLTLSNNCNIGYNTFNSGSDISSVSIKLSKSNNSRIYNNIVNGGPSYDCIDVHYSKENIIENNVINGGLYNGLSLYHVDDTHVVNNTIRGVRNPLDGYVGNGVIVRHSSNITFTKNHIRNNGATGVSFIDSDYCEISLNNITENGYLPSQATYGSGLGLYLSGSFNRIFANNFTDNLGYNDWINAVFINNVYASGLDNVWDDGYPSGGNYWSDYVGYDDYSGEQQSIPGSDGFGDLPYVIDSNNTDQYPKIVPDQTPLETYDYVSQWDVAGSDITVDVSGYVYVTDWSNICVQKFTSDGVYVSQWNCTGYGVAVDSSGYVYVADTFNDRIQKFTSDGVYVSQWGSSGSGDGQFNQLLSVAVDASGYVYVADTYNYRIQKFTSDGVYVSQWGSKGSDNGQFKQPYGVAVDSLGYVYVADTGNNRIQKFTSDGVFVSQWGNLGSGDGQFGGPEGVAVDSSGYVYVTDTWNDRIQKFTSDGVYVSQWGSSGSGDGQLSHPNGIAVDASGYVYVTDTWNDRIQKFTSAFISVVSPDGGEQWLQGSEQSITWLSYGSNQSFVRIELHKNGLVDSVLSTRTENDGLFEWMIPASQTLDSDYRIRVTRLDCPVNDSSDGDFSIVTPASLTVTSPVGGECWAQGSEQSITWTSTGTTGDHVKIELLKGGALDNVITDSAENDGLYSWIISSSQTPGSDYRIRVTSVEYPAITDTSDADFTIESPVSVLFGDGFESGDFAAWDGSSVSSGETATVSTYPVHHGVYSAEFSSNGDSTSESSYVYSNLGSQGEVYVREYVYVSGSGLADYADRFWVMSLYAGWDVVGFAGWYEASGGPRWFLVIRSGTATAIDFSDAAPVTGQWYCVEMHWLKDSVDGFGELYVDGELVCSIGGRDTSVYGDATLLRADLPYVGRCGPTSVTLDCVEVSDEYIGTETEASLTVISPDGGEAWTQGTAYSITWTSTGVIGAVRIELLKAGVLDNVITDSAENDGLYSWIISSSQTPGSDYRIRVTSVEYPAITDTSDADFTIAGSANTPPTADADGPYTATEGTPVTLDGSSSTDLETPLEYRWDYESDGAWDTPWSTDAITTHTWNDDYDGTVTLEVTDGEYSSTDTSQVAIQNVPPTVDAGPDQSVDEGTPVYLHGSITDPGTLDTHSILWNLGNGDTSDQLDTSTTYMDDGVYAVALTVSDDDGGIGTDTLTVTVNDLAPTPEFSWTPEPAYEGTPIRFTDLTASSPDALASWSWAFGNGETSTVQNPETSFMDDGNYLNVLLVMDDDGSSEAVFHYITILDNAPSAEFTWTPEPQVAGEPVQFTDASTSYPDTIVSWSWDFDGHGSSAEQNPSFTFTAEGSYSVSLTVTDDDGSTDTVTHPVSVSGGSEYFSDGFESGSLSAWDGSSISSGEIATISTSPIHHGEYSALFTSNGDSSSESSYVYTTLDPQGEIYVREYVYVSVSGLADNSDRFWTVSMYGGASYLGFAGWYETSGGPRWFLVTRSGTASAIDYSDAAPATGRWYCVELHWVMDSADGLAELYVDGELVCSISGRDTSLYGGVTLLRMGLPYAGRCGPTSVTLDCVEVSDSYIGPETEASLAVVSPNGGESWTQGSMHTVAWASTGTTGDYVKIELLKGGALDSVVTDGTENDGCYNWTIPSGQSLGSDYRVRVTSIDIPSISDSSDAGFSVVAPASLTVVSPDGGESWAQGTLHDITWTSTGSVGDVMVMLFKGGVLESVISSGTENDGVFEWVVPSTQALGSDYRVVVTSVDYVVVSDISDADFSIVAPAGSLDVVSPDGGESWVQGSEHAITWTSTGAVGSVKIELFKGGVLDSVISASEANDGSFDWAIPAGQVVGSDYRVRLTSIDYPTISGSSDADFSISSDVVNALTVTSPDGGESWDTGTVYTITWTSTGEVGSYVRIDLLKGGVLNRVLSWSTANDGSQKWLIPSTLTPDADYSVRVTSLSDTSITDTSDAYFTIGIL